MSTQFLDWVLPASPRLLYVFRGPPGSGKSYTARGLVPAQNIFSADDFFGKSLEEYKAAWSFTRLGAAHLHCQSRLRAAMERGVTPVAADNTHIVLRDMVPYVEMAIRYDYRVEVKESTSPWWLGVSPYLAEKEKYVAELDAAALVLFGKNQHGVALSTIRGCLSRWHCTVSAGDIIKYILRRT